jgi:SecD/SecF fusion protein
MLANALYFLPFTYLNFKINKQADAFSTSEDGNIDLKKKQEYLNSLWNKDVFYGYTYEQIHNKAIKFGLDLQGGMSFIVVVDIEQLIVNLAKKKYRDQIRDILSTFDHKIKDNTKIFVDEIEKVF